MVPRHFRIAMLAACPFPARRGTPLRIERLAEALCNRGHDVEVITYHIGETAVDPSYQVNRIYNRLDYGSLAPGPTPSKLLRYDPALASLTRKVINDRPFDVIHAHHFEGLLAASWGRRRLKLPLVYDAHTMLQTELPTYRPGIGARMTAAVGKWLDGLLPPLADHIVTVTDDIRDRLIKQHRIDPANVTTGMNGVEFQVFEQAARALPIVHDRVIYTGTLANYQNFNLLLDAFALAHKQRPSLHLVCAASSSFAPYEGRARQLGIRQAVTLEAESFDKLPQRLAGASIAVLPRTQCDGIPQKLLNYMAAGMPTIASEGSAKILVNEVNGLVVANNDVQGFANAILRLSREPKFAAQLGRTARGYVIQNCTWDRTAEVCEQIYARLLTPNAGAAMDATTYQEQRGPAQITPIHTGSIEPEAKPEAKKAERS